MARPRMISPNGQRGNGQDPNERKRPALVAFSQPNAPTPGATAPRPVGKNTTATGTSSTPPTNPSTVAAAAATASKKARVGVGFGGTGITIGGGASSRIIQPGNRSNYASNNSNTQSVSNPSQVKFEFDADNTTGMMKDKFLVLFESNPEYMNNGISNSILKDHFGAKYKELVPVINSLMSESRLSMSKNMKGELFYTLVSQDLANKMMGLDPGARMVYQVIQKAGNIGIWTKVIRTQTNIEQQTLNKIFKILEQRKLIKPVKSVNAKSKKLYMLSELTPSKELTGGVWYSDYEFDYEFIVELRTFIIQCIRRLNNGKGVTIKEILDKMLQAKICKVDLSLGDVHQLIQTLIYDSLIEEVSERNSVMSMMNNNTDGIDHSTLYVAARRTTPMCEFKWWNSVLNSDFKYQRIRFEDNVVLSALEPHYHT